MATGDPLSLTILGAPVADASGRTPPIDGAFFAITFAGMARRRATPKPSDPTGFPRDPVADFSSLTINVRDQYYRYDATANAGLGGMVLDYTTRTVKGTLGMPNTHPPRWVSGTVYPAGTWISYSPINGTDATGQQYLYYTENGGTASVAPTHTDATSAVDHQGTTVTGADGIAWTAYSGGSVPGFVEAVSGSDVIVYGGLDFPIFAGTEILSATIGAAAYQALGVSSAASASIPSITNTSTLAYEMPGVDEFSLPHTLERGTTVRRELAIDHPWSRGGKQASAVIYRAVVAGASGARGTVGADVYVTTPTLTTETLPTGVNVEVYGGDVPISALAAGDCFTEYEVYPLLGTAVFKSRYHGDGGEWTASTAYVLNQVIRNGANLYVVKTAGTSAASGGPTGTSTAISDGTITWDFYLNGTDLTKDLGHNPQARQYFYNDPASTYRVGHAHISPLNAGSNLGSPAVFSTYAASRTSALAGNYYGTPQLAEAALKVYNNNGGVAPNHNDSGGGFIWGLAGTYSGFGASMSSATIGAVWLTFDADPAETADSVIFTYNATIAQRGPHRRMIFGSGLRCNLASGSTPIDSQLDGVLTYGIPSCENVMKWKVVATGTTISDKIITRTGTTWYRGMRASGTPFVIGNDAGRSGAKNVVGCDIDWGNTGVGSVRADCIIGNKLRAKDMVRDGNPGTLPALMFKSFRDNIQIGAATVGNVVLFASANSNPYRGGNVGGNLIISTDGFRCWNLAADASAGDLDAYVNFHDHTSVGARDNWAYNDQAQTPRRGIFYHRNGISQTFNIVSGYMNHASSGKNGLRSNNLRAYFAVGHENNVSFQGSGSGGGNLQKVDTTTGFRQGNNQSWAVVDPSFVPNLALEAAQFVNDTSFNTAGSAATYDYHPASGAASLGRALVQMRTYALDGAQRVASGAAGALESLVAPIAFSGGNIAAGGTWSLATAKALAFTGGAITAAGTWTLAPGVGINFAGGAIASGTTPWTLLTAKSLSLTGGAMSTTGTWTLQTSTVPMANPFVGYRNYSAIAFPDDGYAVDYTP